MPIAIYTYSDPYHLPSEPYWEEIKSCPYFCASQTLVNGLKTLYGSDFLQGRVTTVQNLIEAVFQNWENTTAMIKQHALLDQIMTHDVDQTLEPQMQKNLINAFIFNREDVFKSIRILFELNVNPKEILVERITPEQRLIVKIYQTIIESSNGRDFIIENLFPEDKLDKALDAAMLHANASCEVGAISKDHIVIHGLHQFSPIILRAIEQLSQYKKVILLFNYQSQYSAAYQTWIDIYSAFESPIQSFNTPEFLPGLQYKQSYQSNLLAESLGRMINGNMHGMKPQDDTEILEFDNMTEFASYVATLFSAALQSEAKNPLRAMREQIYSANSSVNNILKMYFPEQFGERQFLNYPLGHFFVAIANMWDSQRNRIFIKDLNDIRECFVAGILPEDTPGDLATIYGKMSALFEGCTDINEMLSRLKIIQRSRKSLTDPVYAEHIGHISYYDIEAAEVDQLQRALTELNELALYFYEDFEKVAHNFRDFYRKLRAYIQEQSENTQRLGEEYADILRRVLERLEEAESIDASASFECLKATMSIYLQQEPKEGKGANWIVRSFEQIDGDILRSSVQPDAATYHFACLTDEDLHGVKHSEFTWPLDADFFEVAQEPVDWKYQVFVKSRKEYKNFNRYALLYGLEFNRSNFKLSYVKRDGEKDQTLYSLFKILGLKTVPYKSIRNEEELPDCTHIHVNGRATGSFSEYDYYRYKICRFRFLNESILEGNTIYKDPFLLGKYLEAWLENRVKTEMEGKLISEYIIIKKLNDVFDEISRHFPFVQYVNRMDIINTIRNRIISGKSRTFPKLTPDQRRYMKIRELFIHQSLSDPRTHRKNVLADKLSPVSIETVLEILSDEKLVGAMYPPEPDIWCQYCSIRETCAAFYSLETFKET